MIYIVEFNITDGCTFSYQLPIPVEADSLEEIKLHYLNIEKDCWGNKIFMDIKINKYDSDPEFYTLEEWCEHNKEDWK